MIERIMYLSIEEPWNQSCSISWNASLSLTSSYQLIAKLEPQELLLVLMIWESLQAQREQEE